MAAFMAAGSWPNARLRPLHAVLGRNHRRFNRIRTFLTEETVTVVGHGGQRDSK